MFAALDCLWANLTASSLWPMGYLDCLLVYMSVDAACPHALLLLLMLLHTAELKSMDNAEEEEMCSFSG